MGLLKQNTQTWLEELLSNSPIANKALATPTYEDPVGLRTTFSGTSWDGWLKQVKVKMVNSVEAWEEALQLVASVKLCGLDFETTGLDPWVDRICMIQLAIPNYSTNCEVDLVHPQGKSAITGTTSSVYLLNLNEKDIQQYLPGLVRVLEDAKIQVITQNGVFEQKMLRQAWGKRINAKALFDTMLASQLATAGDYIPKYQLDKWCKKHYVHKEEVGNKIVFLDEMHHEIRFLEEVKTISGNKVKVYYPSHGLQDLALRHLGVVLDKTYQKSDWSGEISEEMLTYAAIDAAILLPLAELLENLLSKNGLEQTAKIEFDCIPAVAEIEWTGMPFNVTAARKLQKDEKEKLLELAKDIQLEAHKAGFLPPPKKGNNTSKQLNPNSSVDLLVYLKLLAEKEKVLSQDKASFVFRSDNTVKEDCFWLSTSKDIIKRVESRLPGDSQLKGFINRLLKYRSLKSRIDGFDAYIKSIHSETNRLHTSLLQLNPLGVGRFSASKPNLQQVSHDSDIRGLFIAGPGRKLLIADYSAIEMRIMAELSEDRTLLKAFEDKQDVHRFTASNTSGKPIESVTEEERQSAKAVNFGLIYGMSAGGLRGYAENSYGVHLTQEEADTARNAFFQLYRGIKQWQDLESKEQFENRFGVFHSHSYSLGYYYERRPGTITFEGRLRVFPKEQKHARESGRPYVSKVGPVTELYNTPDQGCGASIIKVAMRKMYRKLFEKGWDDVLLIMTLHDELVVSAPDEKAETARDLLKDAMVEAWKVIIWNTPIEVSTAIGDSWAAK